MEFGSDWNPGRPLGRVDERDEGLGFADAPVRSLIAPEAERSGGRQGPASELDDELWDDEPLDPALDESIYDNSTYLRVATPATTARTASRSPPAARLVPSTTSEPATVKRAMG